MVPGFNVLFTYVVGADSQKWEALTDSEAADLLVTRVQRLFPDVKVSRPASFHITRHGSDPLTRGAYSATKVGVVEAEFLELAAPVHDNLFFAGEHTCLNYNGYLHGAYWSGVGAAVQVLEKLGKKPTMRTPCSDGSKAAVLLV